LLLFALPGGYCAGFFARKRQPIPPRTRFGSFLCRAEWGQKAKSGAVALEEPEEDNPADAYPPREL
jgi:hypothetical protein